MPLPPPLHFDMQVGLRNGHTVDIQEAHNVSLFRDITTYREVMLRLFESPQALLENKANPHAPICIIVRDQVAWVSINKTF